MEDKIFNEFAEESKKAFEGLKKDITTHANNTDKIRQELEDFKKEWSEYKTAQNRVVAPNATPEKDKSAKFWHALKNGDMQTLQEFKAMSADSDPAGGYLMPVNQVATIVEQAVQYAPMLELANVITISQGDTVEIPLEGSTAFDVAITGETESRTATTSGTVGLARIYVYDYEARPLVTNKLLSDAMFDLEAYITKKISEQIMVKFGTDCVSGNGAGKPSGFTTENVTSVLSGASAALSLATIPKLIGAVKPAYRKNAVWACNGTTLGTIIGLAMSGSYQPVVSFNPTTARYVLFSKDVVEMAELPDIGSSAYPLWYGDFSQACTVVQRADVEVMRNPYASMGWTYFYTKMRLGFKTTNPSALAKMKSNNS